MALGIRFVVPASLLLFAVGCGEQASQPKDAHDVTPGAKPAASPASTASESRATSVTSLKRTAVKQTIAQGLGVFLQNVSVEDWPVMHEGKFHGFKLRTINASWGVDLRPGDVITRINGIVPEHPEEADAALRSLEKAPALKVEFERDGKAKTLELPIVD